MKRVQAEERALNPKGLAGDRTRERGPAVVAPDDEDLEWQLLVAANRDAGCALHTSNHLLALTQLVSITLRVVRFPCISLANAVIQEFT